MRKYTTTKALAVVATGFTLSFLSASVNAAILVSESFAYSDGTLVGQNGGVGWAGPWGSLTTPTQNASGTNMVSGGMLAGGDVTGASTTTSQIFRPLATEFGTDGTTIWLSVDMQRLGVMDTVGGAPDGTAPDLNGGGTSWVRPQNWALFDVTTTAASERLSFGEGTRGTGDTDTFGVLVGGSSTNPATVWTSSPISVLTTALVRIDFIAGVNADTATVWINPSIGDPTMQTPSATTTGNFTFDRVRPFAGNRSNVTVDTVATSMNAAYGTFDEFYIAESWQDIHPVPEPGTAALAGLAGLALLRRRRA